MRLPLALAAFAIAALVIAWRVSRRRWRWPEPVTNSPAWTSATAWDSEPWFA